MRDTERDRETEKQAPCREPDVGLDPKTPGSRPRLKAGVKPLSHQGCPRVSFSFTHSWSLTLLGPSMVPARVWQRLGVGCWEGGGGIRIIL